MIQKVIQQLPAATMPIQISEGNAELDIISMAAAIALSAAATAQITVAITDAQSGVTVWQASQQFVATGATSIVLNCGPWVGKTAASGALGEGFVIPVPERIRGGDTITVSVSVTAGAATMDGAVLRYERTEIA